MGFLVDEGEKFEKICSGCKSLVIVEGSHKMNGDLAFCPFCGISLGEHDPFPLDKAIDRLEKALTDYKSGKEQKLVLKYHIRELNEAITFAHLSNLPEDSDFELIRNDKEKGFKVYSIAGENFVFAKDGIYKSKFRVSSPRKNLGYFNTIKEGQNFIKKNWKGVLGK
jgi:hypothetical protein